MKVVPVSCFAYVLCTFAAFADSFGEDMSDGTVNINQGNYMDTRLDCILKVFTIE